MKILAAVLLAAFAVTGCSKPKSYEAEVKIPAGLMECTDALEKQSEAIKNLEHALDVVGKQRDKLLQDVQSELVLLKKQKVIIDLYQSEYTREHTIQHADGNVLSCNETNGAVVLCSNQVKP